MAYDLFVSYARKDNANSRIDEFVAHLKARVEGVAGREIRIFFDKSEIHGMEDWRHRILRGLRESRLLLAFLSPAYFASEWCQWEFVEYQKGELASPFFGDGVAPILFVDVPGLDGDGFAKEHGPWLADLRRRNHFDLRPWYAAGAAALGEPAVAQAMASLQEQLGSRLRRVNQAGASPGNVPRPNPHFVGRRAELPGLRESLALRRVGVLTTAHGLGGMGKTTLAVAYAHAFAHEYGGGRWLIPCAGQDDLRLVLAGLHHAPGLAFEFTEAEKLDLDKQFARVLRNLQARAAAGEPPACLVILDNVDQPALLAPAQLDRLPAADWLQVLATSRLGEEDLHGLGGDREFVDVDKLPPDDALDLLRSFQPGEKFQDDREEEAARDIVRLLDGFPLAVESAAVYLGETANQGVTCAGFLALLRDQGITGLDEKARGTQTGVRHVEKRLRATLLPTLELLSPVERCVLDYAALLPPDAVALPWLRSLVVREHPELNQEVKPGCADPWLSALRRLFSLRLLQLMEIAEGEKAPRLARQHRLIQDLLRREMAREVVLGRYAAVTEVVADRVKALREETRWVQARWELRPLEALARADDEQGHEGAAWLLNEVGYHYYIMADWPTAEPLFRRALALDEASKGPNHPHVATMCSNLAKLLQATNRLAEAEHLHRRALAIDEARYGSEHPDVARDCNNLAELQRVTNRYAEAEPLYRRALAIDQATYGPEHPEVATSCNNLALLLFATNRLDESEQLFRHALSIDEAHYGPDHPDVARDANNLALLLQATSRHAEAEQLFRRVLTILKASYGPKHPKTATACNNLAMLLQATNRLGEAEQLFRRALDIDEASYGPKHPDVARDCNNLAELLRLSNRLGEAEPLYRRALAIWETSYGPEHPNVATACNNLAGLLSATNRLAEAEPPYRRALAIDEASYGPDHPAVATDCNNLAELLRATNRLAEAEPLYRRALAIDEASYGPDHPDVATDCNNLAVLLEDTNRLAEAEPLYRRALAIFEASYGPEHPNVITVCNNLATLLRATNRHAEAEQLLQRYSPESSRS
ncbi:MAG: tetratricopeptide repeat protein [Deltaproteobacteria bacterium]|nr:tetratricopeptide repeat protein [Deltaproteobacteria bacterium]